MRTIFDEDISLPALACRGSSTAVDVVQVELETRTVSSHGAQPYEVSVSRRRTRTVCLYGAG